MEIQESKEINGKIHRALLMIDEVLKLVSPLRMFRG